MVSPVWDVSVRAGERHMQLSQERRSSGWRLGVRAIAVCGPCLQPVSTILPPNAHDPVEIVSICNDHSRQIALALSIEGTHLTLQATCIVDGPGSPRQETHGGHLTFPAGSGMLISVYAAEAMHLFETQVTIDGVAAQVVEIRRRDGRACATVSAKATRKDPVPRRFIAANGQWGQSVGYMLDEQCKVLAVSLGNRVAVFSPVRPVAFDLYGISFNIK